MCHLADVLQGMYNEAQGPLEGKSSPILALVGFRFCHALNDCHSFEGCALPHFPHVSVPATSRGVCRGSLDTIEAKCPY